MPYFTPNITEFKSFIPAPTYILENAELNFTEKCVYLELLARMRLSQTNASLTDGKGKWVNEKNEVYIYYPIKKLAEKIGRGESAIKNALNSLEKEGLLRRERQGRGKANKLYLQYPKGECFEKGVKPHVKKDEKPTTQGQKSDYQGGKKPTGNNINDEYNYNNKGGSCNGRKSGNGYRSDSCNARTFKTRRWEEAF